MNKFKGITKRFGLFIMLLCSCQLIQLSQNFNCQDQNLEQICKDQNKKPVCAFSLNNQYLTFDSACEACRNSQVLSYKLGSCICPDISCPKEKYCINGQCLDASILTDQQLKKQVYELIIKQKHSQAIPLVQKLINRNLNDDYSYYLASLATYGAQKYKQSLKYIKKAIQIDPNVSGYYIIRGRAFLQINQNQQAQKQFQKTLELGFQDVGLVSFYQALNYLKAQNNEKAIQKFEEALKYHPQKTQWYVRKAMAHAINKEIKMALVTCKQGLKIDPNNNQIKLFMKQFDNIELGHEQKLQKVRQQNEKVKNGRSQTNDPQYINKIIKQRLEEKQLQFDMERIKQKSKKKSESQQKRNGKLQDVQL